MTWCIYLQSFEKYINAFSSYSAKTKRDGRTDRREGGGALQYLPPRAYGAAGDNKFFICENINIIGYLGTWGEGGGG